MLYRHPAIDDVAVFGVPDDDWGERVHAAVQPLPGAALTADEVVAFARGRMADYSHGGLLRSRVRSLSTPDSRGQGLQARAARSLLGRSSRKGLTLRRRPRTQVGSDPPGSPDRIQVIA